MENSANPLIYDDCGHQNISRTKQHLNKLFKNSLIIHEENTKKNHKRVVSLYVAKDFPSFT